MIAPEVRLSPDGDMAPPRPPKQTSSWRPESWTRTGALKLNEVVVLRRMRGGERQTDIARALGWTPTTVFSLFQKMRTRFGVDTNEELLAHPSVVEQLRSDSSDGA